MPHARRATLALLGALTVLCGGARAAERPERAEAAVRPCPRHGPGFVRLPGSEVCLRVSGRLAAGIGVGAAARPAAPSGFAATGPATRAEMALDARTDTEWGPLRAYARIGTRSPGLGRTRPDQAFIRFGR